MCCTCHSRASTSCLAAAVACSRRQTPQPGHSWRRCPLHDMWLDLDGIQARGDQHGEQWIQNRQHQEPMSWGGLTEK
jgi:hypothetical protein